MNDLLAYLPDFAIPMKLVDKNPFCNDRNNGRNG